MNFLFSNLDAVYHQKPAHRIVQGNKNPFKPIVQQRFMNSQQVLGRLDVSNSVNLLILFKAYAKIFLGH